MFCLDEYSDTRLTFPKASTSQSSPSVYHRKLLKTQSPEKLHPGCRLQGNQANSLTKTKNMQLAREFQSCNNQVFWNSNWIVDRRQEGFTQIFQFTYPQYMFKSLLFVIKRMIPKSCLRTSLAHSFTSP